MPPTKVVTDINTLLLDTTSDANPINAENGKLRTEPANAKFDPRYKSLFCVSSPYPKSSAA